MNFTKNIINDQKFQIGDLNVSLGKVTVSDPDHSESVCECPGLGFRDRVQVYG